MRYVFGRWDKSDSPLTASDVVKICDEAEKRRNEIADYPLDKVFFFLERLRKLWASPDFPIRIAAQKALSDDGGYSAEMVKIALNELSVVFNPAFLERKIKTELRGIPKIGDWKFNSNSCTALAWQPLGVMLHVLSGNAFLVAAGSLVEGLITGNLNIFKMSSDEKIFLPHLIESFSQCDEEKVISNSMAVLEYSSSQLDVISELKRRVDGIVVWGGEDAVNAYRKDLPARTKFIVYGPKLSLAVISESGFNQNEVSEIGERIAREVAIWDQQACTAPQVCYVQGKDNALNLAKALATAFEKITAEIPPGEISLNTAVEIRKLRTVFEIAEAKGEGRLFCPSENLDWTVILDYNQTLEPSPLHRTIRILPYSNFDVEVLPQIASLRGYIQSVGFLLSESEQIPISETLSKAGALRMVELGQMAGGEIDDPHDGSYDLPQFVNIVFNRKSDQGRIKNPLEFCPFKEREKAINEKLRRLIDRARSSEFYKKFLETLKVETVNDLPMLPILTRSEMEANIPPNGNGLSTGVFTGGYVSRSGGSTGEPKFSIYDSHDWDEMINHAVGVFRSIGLSPQDKVANCFLAGDLYGSFVSFDHINCRVGVTTFAFANSAKPEVFLDTYRKFKINSIMGVPTQIVPLLRAVKKMDPSFALQKVIYAGSPLSKSDFDWIKTELKSEIIASVIGANDGGQIAFQCPKMKGSIHHLVDDFNYVEIVDDQGKRVPDGEIGRILITSLLKYAFPLIRYEVGDLGKIIPGKCSCGRNLRVMEYLGRSDDIIVVGMLNMCYRDFREALKEFPISELQFAAGNEDGKEFITLRIETEKPLVGMKTQIHEALLKNVAKLNERLENGYLSMIDIEFFRPGELPRNSRSGKLKNVVDERI